MRTIAIVGRPNVGKSTLFNRLIGRKQAIIDDISGVTRDRHYGLCDWGGKTYNVIDTGGFVPKTTDVFELAIRDQVGIAINEADLLLFMVDVEVGVTDQDEEMARLLRKSKKEVLLVVNKVDNTRRHMEIHEFYKLGYDELYPVSSMNGSGTGEILDKVLELLPDAEEEEESDLPRFTIIGQPNVGKSSLLNALVGEERNIVTDIAGTTRDSIHTRYNLFGKDLLLIDTAGLRKKGKVHENLEFYSVMRAIRSMDSADVCFVMLDANEGVESQDQAIFSLAARKKKGVVVLVNKWDQVTKERNADIELRETIEDRFSPFTDIPIVFISALNKQRIHKAVEEGLRVYENLGRKITTSKLNDLLLPIIARTPPPSVKGRFVKIKFITQLPTRSPSFAFFCNHPNLVREDYQNFLENRLREQFDFTGVPLSLFFRKK